MPLERHGPEFDLLYPLPPTGARWHHHRVYTNYFGFTVPEEGIGVFAYLRCQPAFPLSHGGITVFRGTDNLDPWTRSSTTTRSPCRGLRSSSVQAFSP